MGISDKSQRTAADALTQFMFTRTMGGESPFVRQRENLTSIKKRAIIKYKVEGDE